MSNAISLPLPRVEDDERFQLYFRITHIQFEEMYSYDYIENITPSDPNYEKHFYKDFLIMDGYIK